MCIRDSEKNIFQRPFGNSFAERDFFRAGLAADRFYHRRKNNGFMERICRNRRRLRCLRIEYILLRPRPKNTRCSQDKRLLRRLAFYRNVTFAGNFPRNTALYLFYRPRSHDNRRMAFVAGQRTNAIRIIFFGKPDVIRVVLRSSKANRTHRKS